MCRKFCLWSSANFFLKYRKNCQNILSMILSTHEKLVLFWNRSTVFRGSHKQNNASSQNKTLANQYYDKLYWNREVFFSNTWSASFQYTCPTMKGTWESVFSVSLHSQKFAGFLTTVAMHAEILHCANHKFVSLGWKVFICYSSFNKTSGSKKFKN